MSISFVPSRHPLFPLLTLLFEKCEQATQGSECITSASFDVDIENFVHQQEQEHKPFFSDDPELDNLVEAAGGLADGFAGPGVGWRGGRENVGAEE